MRRRGVTRTVVSFAAVAGIAAGGLAGATSVAAQPAQPAQYTAQYGIGHTTGRLAPLAVNNLGLNASEATWVQCFIKRYYDYNGALDGKLGTDSWKAMQRFLKRHWGYNDDIDGIVGKNTISALQRNLKQYHGYTGNIDGIAGAKTKAAFKDFAADSRQHC
ncbi:peptidoglycan-binding domain-containing protein [Streptomyces rimosus]|uniref:peptidoglycan-binding domain-containing protein n=1 Tax=Streptomyces rimosus TaxID=1927 RepID=UPI0004CABAE2|nr:peptidoglycan-binding domain-containing protein [Streptomyces rimosus]